MEKKQSIFLRRGLICQLCQRISQKAALVKMISEKIFQWDDIYPTRADFETDIMKGELTVGVDEKSGKLVCIYVINSQHIVCSEMVFFISSSFSKESS